MAEPAADPWAGFNLAPAPAAAAAKDDPWAGFNLNKPEEKGPLARASDAIGSAASWVKKTVVGENEFDYPEVTAGLAAGGSAAALKSKDGELLPFLSRLNRARGEEGLLDVLRTEDPNLVTSKDKFGNVVVNYLGKPYYLNKSGVSERDVSEFTRDALITAPLSGAGSVITKGMALLPRLGAQAVAGGTGSLGSDAVSAAAGSEQGVDLAGLIGGIIGGGAGELIGTAGSALINRIKSAPSRFVGPSGALTPEGEKIFAAAGFDPADISEKLGRAFAARARTTGPTPATAREVAANEFGVPLTRGQATQDFDQIAFEQAAKAGARGEMAGDIMRGRFGAQKEATDAAKAQIGDQIAPLTPTRNVQESAGVALEGVRAEARTLKDTVDAAYDVARAEMSGAAVDRGAVTELPNIARAALREQGFVFDKELMPLTTRALEMLDNLGALKVTNEAFPKNIGPKNMDDVVGVAMDAIEMVRKNIGGKTGLLAKAGDDAERAGLKTVMKSFDEWLNSVSDAALISGRPEAVEAIKAARAEASKRFSLIGKRNELDDAGPVIDRMIRSDVTEQEVANFLYGAGKVGESGRGYRVAKRIEEMVGRESDAWDAIRRGMWQRLTENAEGKTQPGAQAVAQNIFEFVNGKGKAMAELLFDDAERATMRRFAKVMKDTVPPVDATNPSKSGYEVARAVGGLFNANAPFYVRIFGLAGNAKNTLKAIPSGAPPMRSPAPVGVPALGAAGGESSTDQ
jgi:hypothetical protein